MVTHLEAVLEEDISTHNGSFLPRFVSTGSVVIDLPMRVLKLPDRGTDAIAYSSGTVVGGGFNVVSAAARQGTRVALASPLGTGPNSAQVRNALSAEGIETLFDEMVGDTGLCIALVEPSGERTFVTTLGVEAEPQPEDLESLRLYPGDYLYVSGYDLAYPTSGPVLVPWLETIGTDVVVVMDTSPIVNEIRVEDLRRVLSRVDVLTMNRREARLLGDQLGVRDWTELGKLLAPNRLVVRRTGEHGCEILRTSNGGSVTVPAYPVDPIDTTGAGDAHTGVLVAALMDGHSIFTAADRANAAAALTATRQGPATCPTRAEIDEFVAQHSQGRPQISGWY